MIPSSPSVDRSRQSQALDGIGEALQECFAKPGNNLFRDVERRLVEDAFRHCNENQVRTAELLGISRNVVRTLLKRYGLLNEADASLAEPIEVESLRHPEKLVRTSPFKGGLTLDECNRAAGHGNAEPQEQGDDRRALGEAGR